MKEGSNRHRSIISVANLMKTLGVKKTRGYYDASIVTRMMRNVLGGNSFTTALFCIK